MKRLIFSLFILAASYGQAAEVNLLNSSVVDSSALNFADVSGTKFNRNVNGRTYQRFPMATFKGYQYAIYYNASRNVAVGRRKLPDGDWDVITFTDYKITNHDSHNVCTIGICAKDGTIHLAFDHHKSELHYRVSALNAASNPDEVEWSTALFGARTDRLGSVGAIKSLTYPSFFNAPNGNLMLYYRSGGSGSGDGMIQEYNGTRHNWTTGLGKFISRSGSYSGELSQNSTTRNPYINGISYAGNRLHASWGWRESANGGKFNHDLNYVYSDDNGRTWYNNSGRKIGTTGSSYISIKSTGLLVASIPQNIGLSNQYTHYAFSDGSCHVMVAHKNTSNQMRYHHYWRNANGVWTLEVLPFTGSRPKMVGDDDGNLYLAYVSGSKPRIAKGVPNSSKTKWTWTRSYTQSDTTEAGEGQLDYSRWEEERVLSFYGQENPSSTGEVPSALHVFDYQVSSKAIQPFPVNGADASAVKTLQWVAGIGAKKHHVYLGTNRSSVARATTGSSEYQGLQTSADFRASRKLTKLGTYYWRVDEVLADSTVVPGAVWAFNLTDLPSQEDLGVIFAATDYDVESDPGNDNRIRNNGSKVGYIVNGTWICYNDFNFGAGAARIDIEAASGATGGRIEIRAGSVSGSLLGTVNVTATGGWGAYSTFGSELGSISGTKDLYFVFKGGSGGLMNVRSFLVTAGNSDPDDQEAKQIAATMLSPANGTVFSESSVTFKWKVTTGEYHLYVGTTVGGNQLFSQAQNGTSQTVNNLPTDGSEIYVRLWTKVNGSWKHKDYSYTAKSSDNGDNDDNSSNPVSSMISPANGSTLAGSSVVFNWKVTSGEYYLYVGTTVGGNQLFSQGQSGTSQTVNNLPTDGRKIYVRLWTKVNGSWKHNDYTYTAKSSWY